MRITMLGAAGEVTGSSYLVETRRARVLVDFGLFQGGPHAEVKNRRIPDLDADRLDAVIVTHAHLDHTGRLPLLTRMKFDRPIHATPATCDLAAIVMADTAHLQVADAQRASRHRLRAGRERPATPLYTPPDAEAVRSLFRGLAYEERREVAPGITIRFFDAGHILGSASVELVADDGASAPRTVVFSGDIGVRGAPLLRDPTPPPAADMVILESTYGDRDHKPRDQTVREFEELIAQASWHKEKVLVPAFAIGRTQTIIYALGELFRTDRVPRMPVYVDSPMAIAATELYVKHRELFDEETWRVISNGDSPLKLPEVRYVRTSDESKQLNEAWGCGIVIAGSGMCTGGRILHHLWHNLWRKGVHVLIAGYQAEGSLGRRLVNGEKSVRIFGKPVDVRATVDTLGGFSAHAGQSELLDWIAPAAASKPRIVLTHGEDKGRTALAAELRRRHAIEPTLPVFGQTVEL